MGKRIKISEGPKCEKCNGELVTEKMTIAKAPCWNCSSEMKIAYITSDPMSMLRGHTTVPPSYFTPEEIEFAKAKGVLLALNHSKTMEKSYIANTCENCSSFCGDFFLFEDYVIPVHDGIYLAEVFNLGTICPSCDDKNYSHKNS